MNSTATPTLVRGTSRWSDFVRKPIVAVAMIVVSSAVVAVFAPDLVTGSAHEHLPLAAVTIWPWAAAAIGYVLMAGRRGGSTDLALGVALVWLSVAVLAVAVPAMVTGTDPTRIPLAAVIVPPFGAIATGFLAIAHVTAHDRRRKEE